MDCPTPSIDVWASERKWSWSNFLTIWQIKHGKSWNISHHFTHFYGPRFKLGDSKRVSFPLKHVFFCFYHVFFSKKRWSSGAFYRAVTGSPETPGVSMGLSVSSVGGQLLFIEATKIVTWQNEKNHEKNTIYKCSLRLSHRRYFVFFFFCGSFILDILDFCFQNWAF